MPMNCLQVSFNQPESLPPASSPVTSARFQPMMCQCGRRAFIRPQGPVRCALKSSAVCLASCHRVGGQGMARTRPHSQKTQSRSPALPFLPLHTPQAQTPTVSATIPLQPASFPIVQRRRKTSHQTDNGCLHAAKGPGALSL